MTLWFHITVGASHVPYSLISPQMGDWVWPRLQVAFPRASSACLMPDHFHVAHPFMSAEAARRAAGALLSGLRRSRHPIAELRWECQIDVQPIANRKIHRRTTRYVNLNPSRSNLVDDPLEWPYSTYRDSLGAVSDPWVRPTELAAILGYEPSRFHDEFHRYVSSDTSVNVVGTHPPRVTHDVVFARPFAAVIAAACAATRARPEALRRRSTTRAVFLALAQRHGWADGTLLRWTCDVSRKTIHRHRYGAAPVGLAAAELCLAEPRLVRYLAPEVRAFIARVIEPKLRRCPRHVHPPEKWRHVTCSPSRKRLADAAPHDDRRATDSRPHDTKGRHQHEHQLHHGYPPEDGAKPLQLA